MLQLKTKEQRTHCDGIGIFNKDLEMISYERCLNLCCMVNNEESKTKLKWLKAVRKEMEGFVAIPERTISMIYEN